MTPINVGDQFELFGTDNIIVVTGKKLAGHWVVDIKREPGSNDVLSDVLMNPEILREGIETGKLSRI